MTVLLHPLASMRGPTLDFDSLMSADVGAIVLRHLASTQDRVRICRCVNQECRQLVDSQVHSLRADLKTLSTHDESLALPLCFPRLERLSFDRAAASECSTQLLQLAVHQPHLLAHLQELDLSTCKGLEPEALSALLRAATCLTSLRLPPVSPSVVAHKEDIMKAISTHSKQLQHLQGVGDYLDTNCLPQLAQLTALQSLDLSTEGHALPIPPSSLQLLSRLTALTSLHLGNHLVGHELFELVAGLPVLAELGFSYVSEVHVSVQEFSPLRRSKTLQRLELAGVDCTDELLGVLAGSAITDLTLTAGGFRATAKGAAAMAGRLQGLQLSVKDTTLAAVTSALPVLGSRLTQLSLCVHKACGDYTQLMQAVFALPALQQLSLASHYKGLSECELRGLPVAPHLTQLSLHNHFIAGTMSCVLRSAPSVRHLHLCGCAEVGSAGLALVQQYCRGLQSVHLELMRGVDAAAVAALAAGPYVSRVVLEGCRNVAAEECRELMQRLGRPELDIIKLR